MENQTREVSLAVLTAYLDRAPMLPDVSTPEGSVARMKWLLGLIDASAAAAQATCRQECEAAYQAGYEAALDAVARLGL